MMKKVKLGKTGLMVSRVARARLGRLRSLCEEQGRDYDSIKKTIQGTVRIAPDAMTAEDVLDICVELGELGIKQVILNMPNSHEIEAIGEEIIHQVRGI